MGLIDSIKENAKKELKIIVLPESEDERVLKAAQQVLTEKTAKVVLIGNPQTIQSDASKCGANIFACVRSNTKNFKSLVSQLKKKYKVKIYIVQLDLSNNSSILKCANEINRITRKIDVVVNNAGMLFNSLFLMTSEKQ